MRLIDADELWTETTKDIECCGDFLEVIERQPTVEPTLYGYKIEHLALIASVMQKDGITPERAVQMFGDAQAVAKMVIDEMNGIVKRTFEQLTETIGSGDDLFRSN